MNSQEKYGFLIPVYNHGEELQGVLENLLPFSLPFILVDDGSNEGTKNCLQKYCQEYPSINLITLPRNTGKGGAVIAGIKYAYQHNFSHVFQIDADGQHDTGCCEDFIRESKLNPRAMICGQPVYDESVPKIRQKGRKFGNLWGQIVSVSSDIQDSMCGFRIYPVAPAYQIVSTAPLIDKRMGFDPEILIRLKWKNTPFIFLPVLIRYPENGVSHYHVVRDNVRMTTMFTRTFIGMILRLPLLLARKISGRRSKMTDEKTQKHWSQKKEAVSTSRGLHILMVLSKYVPYFVVKLVVIPVALFYFLFYKDGRIHSKEFLTRVSTVSKQKHLSVLTHFISFALNLVEKMQSWNGRFSFKNIEFKDDDVKQLINHLEAKQGALLICSHLGNAELLRAMAELDKTGVSKKIPDISIVDFSVSPHFFRMINNINSESMLHIISAKDIGPDTVILLQQHIESGGLVVIAGDRTSATTTNSYLTLPFLNEPAAFAMGPFLLALIMGVPCYSVFGLRNPTLSLFPKYKMYVERLEIPQQYSRKERTKVLEQITQQFVLKLEKLCLQYPYQWYNFYSFWAKPDLGD